MKLIIHFKPLIENTRYLLIGHLMIVLSILFNNCSQPGEISLVSSSSEVLATDEVVLVNLRSCQEAHANGTLKSLNQNIVFNDTRVESGLQQICSFPNQGEDLLGNLTMFDGQLRSRYEQSVSLQLPEKAVICNISMQNNLQRFRYDDVFFLTFNNYILATNDKSAVFQRINPERANSVQGQMTYDLYPYNWSLLRTAHFENRVDDFCLGNSVGLGHCSWPVTEQLGQIQMSWNPEVFIRLSSGVSAQNQTFKFVITGDNDPQIDCYHERLEFNTSVEYIISE